MNDVMQIFFKDSTIGEFGVLSVDNTWIGGWFRPHEDYHKHKAFLEAHMSEEEFDDTMFSEDLFDYDNWSVKADDDIYESSIPYIHL